MRIFATVLSAAVTFVLSTSAFACCVLDLRVSQKEVEQFTVKARNGDSDAMWRLYQHYSLTDDAWNHVYWGERLARVNDKRVLISLADFYDQLGDPTLCKRAIELTNQYAGLSTSAAEQDAARKIGRHYAGIENPNGKCGLLQRPNDSFKLKPDMGGA